MSINTFLCTNLNNNLLLFKSYLMNTNSEQIKSFISGIEYGLKLKYNFNDSKNNFSEEKN